MNINEDTYFDQWQRHAEQEEFGAIRVALELSKIHRIIPRQDTREAPTTENRD